MSTLQTGNRGPRSDKSGSGRVSNLPPAPRTRSRAGSAGDPQGSAVRDETAQKGLSPEELVNKMFQKIREENRKVLENEIVTLSSQLKLQAEEFAAAMENLSARIETLEGKANAWSDPEMLKSLQDSAKEARHDANQALESLAKSRDEADERFGRVAIRLKALEQARDAIPQRNVEDDMVQDDHGQDGAPHQEKLNQRFTRTSKSKKMGKTLKDKSKWIKKNRNQPEDPEGSSSSSDSESADSNSDEGTTSSEKSDRKTTKSYNRTKGNGVTSKRGGIDSSVSRRDVKGEPEDIATRRGPRWEHLKELQPTNYLFKHLLSYRTYRLRNPQTHLTKSRRSAVRKIRRDIPPKVKKEITFTGDDAIMVLDFCCEDSPRI